MRKFSQKSIFVLMYNGGFEDMFQDKEIPPIRGIEHKIEFIPRTVIPNKSAYRVNPIETKEFQRQVKELMEKGYIRESLSPCSIRDLLVSKKDETWHMCMDNKVINKITVKYRHPIPRLDDMLDLLHDSCLFIKIMPFGLTNAPSTFMGLIYNVLREYKACCCLC